MNNPNTEIDRLNFLIAKFIGTGRGASREFARLLEISEKKIFHWRTGRYPISHADKDKICKKLSINRGWFDTGNGAIIDPRLLEEFSNEKLQQVILSLQKEVEPENEPGTENRIRSLEREIDKLAGALGLAKEWHSEMINRLGVVLEKCEKKIGVSVPTVNNH